jgi:hypothetical protein
MQPTTTTTTTTEDRPMMMSAYERLNQLASELVGDGKSPNLYFVTDGGSVLTVTLDGRLAYQHWRALAARRPRVDCALEDRETGVLCSVEPAEDSGGRRVVHDDYARLTGDQGDPDEPVTVRQTACRHCGLDIEGFAPYARGQWQDRGGNRTCNDGKHAHAPVPE